MSFASKPTEVQENEMPSLNRKRQLRSVTNQPQVLFLWLFLTICLRQLTVISILEPSRLIGYWHLVIKTPGLSFVFLSEAVSAAWRLTSGSTLHAKWATAPRSIICRLLRALLVIACKLGSILFDGPPIHLTHVHLYELNSNPMALFGTSISSLNESITSWMTFHTQYGPHTVGRPHAYFIYLCGVIDDTPHSRITKVLVLYCIDPGKCNLIEWLS